MGIKTPYHPEITTGYLQDFGYHKLKRQVKSIYVNMITDFFSRTRQIHQLEVSEVKSVETKENTDKRIFVERDFPYYERKIPLIVPTVDVTDEVKPFLGNDDFLYTQIQTAEDGSKSGHDVYANMVNLAVAIFVVADSSDLRDKLAELLFQCFTHYYRGNYIYYDDDGNMYSIVPNTRKIRISQERELQDEDKTMIIYTLSLDLAAFVEYHFKAVGEDRYREVKNVKINHNDNYNEDTDQYEDDEGEPLQSGPVEFQ